MGCSSTSSCASGDGCHYCVCVCVCSCCQYRYVYVFVCIQCPASLLLPSPISNREASQSVAIMKASFDAAARQPAGAGAEGVTKDVALATTTTTILTCSPIVRSLRSLSRCSLVTPHQYTVGFCPYCRFRHTRTQHD